MNEAQSPLESTNSLRDTSLGLGLLGPGVALALALFSGGCSDPGQGAEVGSETGSEEMGSEEMGSEETGGEIDQSCFSQGTALLAELAPIEGEVDPGLSCLGGWSADAPTLDATWSALVLRNEVPWGLPQLAAHPDGGVVFSGPGLLARFSGEGDMMWSESLGAKGESKLSVEPEGTILVVTYDSGTGNYRLRRFPGEGGEGSELPVPLTAENADIWGLARSGEDLVLAAVDENSMGLGRPTLLRVGPGGEELLRKSSPFLSSRVFALNDVGVAFLAPFFVSVVDGAVNGSLIPSVGFVVHATSLGDDFAFAYNTSDMVVARVSPTGVERWVRSYDHFGGFDSTQAVSAGPEGGVIAVGNVGIGRSGAFGWFANTQPRIIGIDGDGAALWQDRIDAHGQAFAVTLGVEGEVYVAGGADMVDLMSELPVGQWLRRYDP